MQERAITSKKCTSHWLFFALAFVLSWLFWIPAAIISQSKSPSFLGILYVLGGFGPSISGVFMVYWTQEQAGRRDFWQRALSFRRIGRGWCAFTLLAFPVLVALSVCIEILAGRNIPIFPYLAMLAKEPLLIMWIPMIALQVAILGPVSEELGWRGYAIDALQVKWSALVSSLVVGFFWSVWHGPLFFIRDQGNFYYEWGVGTTLFWLFMLRMVLLSVLITWIYNNNRRSILAAILFHFAYNFTFSFVYPIPEAMHLYGTLLILAMAVMIVVIWGPQTLTRRKALGME